MPFELRNPRAVMAALQNRPQDVLEIRLRGSRPQDAWADVAGLAAKHGIAVRTRAPRVTQSKGRRGGTERTGAAEATVREPRQRELSDVLSTYSESSHGLWLALDCVQDPQNVGAIFRSAAFFGIRGVIMTKDRSAPLNATVCDIAAGGVEYVPFSIETNLRRTIDLAKEAGLWVLGTSEHAKSCVTQVDRQRSWLLIVGNEQKGMRRLTSDQCDDVCRFEPRGGVTSLNVSVAAGALMAVLTQ